MGENYIPLSMLNDYIFCPYSIYLHNIYMEADEGVYHATPQVQGRIAHDAVDHKRSSTRKDDLMAFAVYSDQLGIIGKIDTYKSRERHLIERKYQLRKIYQGQLYQLWGEFFCMKEMGYEIEKVSFYEISTNTMMPQQLPRQKEWEELKAFVERFRAFDPSQPVETNPNKCAHCIYCPLCEKSNMENVY